MISFYPGPSQVYPFVKDDMIEAFNKGILGINHRSSAFIEISKECIGLLKKKLLIPEDYSIFFTSSATECWEIIAQSVIKEDALFLFNGAFGQKWFETTLKIKPKALKIEFDLETPIEAIAFSPIPELIAIVQNETSNATQISNDIIQTIRHKNQSSLIAVDATSSLGGIKLDFNQGDIWFASVQKCLGLPAGLGVMICSPKVKSRVQYLGENKHYNSLQIMYERMESYQTTHTPNILGIYLLMKCLRRIEGIELIEQKTLEKSSLWYEFLESEGHKLLIKNKLVRSDTVIAVKCNHPEDIKEKAKKNGIILGNGYGHWADKTFRIANFPAHTMKDISLLMNLLKRQ